MSLPQFPDFKQLQYSDKEDVEEITNQFPPYSDYNFVSLWSWDTKQQVKVSVLNDNLLLRFIDYVNFEPFYTFLGNNKVFETITALLGLSVDEGITPQLKLIPEHNLLTTNKSELHKFFLIKEDRDNFDYILSSEDVANMLGEKFHKKRNMIRNFNKLYGLDVTVESLSLNDSKIQKEIESLFQFWRRKSKKTLEESQNELDAMKKLIANTNSFNLIASGYYIRGKLAGYSIKELLSDYCIIHFEKADTSYSGIYEFMKQSSAKNFLKYGCKYINAEQDLGIEGLRKSKLLYRPIAFLRKFTVSLLQA